MTPYVKRLRQAKADLSYKDIRKKELPVSDVFLAAREGFTVVDVELAGRAPDDIIEIAAIRVSKSGRTVAGFHRMVRPYGPMSEEVMKLTRIYPPMIRHAPRALKALKELQKFIGDDLLIGHGLADNDIPVMSHVLMAHGKEPLANYFGDTHTIAKALLPKGIGFSVKKLCRYYGLPYTVFHRAVQDCRAERGLFEALRIEAISPGFIHDDRKIKLFRETGQFSGGVWPKIADSG